MNSCIPDWNFEADLPLTNQKKPSGPDHELVELLWRNGQVVLQSQTNRKQGGLNPNESRQVHQKHDQLGGFYGNSGHLIHDEEAVSMIQYPLEDSFDKEFGSHFFSELASCDPLEIERPIKQFGGEEKFVKFDASNGNHNLVSPSLHTNVKSGNRVACHENPMPPPRFQISNPTEKSQNLGGLGKVVNFSQFSALGKGDIGSVRKQMRGAEPGKLNQVEVREGSMMTVGSSYSGSNQVIPSDFDVSRTSSNGDGTTLFSTGTLYENVQKMMPLSEGAMTETLDPTLATSSGGSGSSFGRRKQSNVVNSNKRKGRDAEDSECQSEAAETDSAAGNKRAPQSGSSRRTRAAEVHNLSERRRRDRINEKMKALQELIPHSNKTDKASMLDEAIEYLKSLQLQLQVMWMGGGMTPMMFPGVQHYMSRMGMGMGMGPAAMPSMHNPMQLPRVPIVDQCMPVAPPTNQAVMCQTPVLNPVDYHNQMQNPAFQEQYARLMGFHHMQTMSQPMNMFRFNSQSLPQSQMMASTGMNTGTLSNGAATNEGVSGKMSKSFQPLLG